VYAAERAAFGTTATGAEPSRDLADQAARAAAILQSAHVRAQYPWAPLTVKVLPKRGGGATAWYTCIEMDSWTRQPGQWWVIYHEVTHIIVGNEPGPEPAAHGWRFCQVYVALVRALHSEAAATALQAAFKARRVRYRRPPRISPERRAALRAQARAYGQRRRAEAAVDRWAAAGGDGSAV